MAEAKKTDPKLWEKVKDEITDSSKGGKKGQWSARKAQMAVQEYKRRGGGYADDGPDQDQTHLHQWTEEEWGTKSGKESLDSGERYLPKEVRLLLTEDEYARSTQAKKGADGQYADQPDDVARKAARIRKSGPTRRMIEERASELGIRGRSSMGKDALLRAIDKATDDNGRAPGSRAALDAMSKAELQDKARQRGIEGRSGMSKDDLVAALADGGGGLGGKSKDELYRMAQKRDIDGRSRMSRDDLVRALS
ncbi:Rho termination factor N-terminal domain-containing protein [Citreimonas sp.]|uniref:Rho termination factor N-terminal domain-containing protein n=1 Tax=Citreimonas sp. TaxID=3036715 RepID=UPI00405A33C3